MQHFLKERGVSHVSFPPDLSLGIYPFSFQLFAFVKRFVQDQQIPIPKLLLVFGILVVRLFEKTGIQPLTRFGLAGTCHVPW